MRIISHTFLSSTPALFTKIVNIFKKFHVTITQILSSKKGLLVLRISWITINIDNVWIFFDIESIDTKTKILINTEKRNGMKKY